MSTEFKILFGLFLGILITAIFFITIILDYKKLFIKNNEEIIEIKKTVENKLLEEPLGDNEIICPVCKQKADIAFVSSNINLNPYEKKVHIKCRYCDYSSIATTYMLDLVRDNAEFYKYCSLIKKYRLER